LVNRAGGVTVTWSGGAPGTYVQISGSSTIQSMTVSFVCNAPVSALQFRVPPEVLLALPASNDGTLALDNVALPQSCTAPGLDLGYKFAGFYVGESVPYR
jgi:hypothetical protein